MRAAAAYTHPIIVFDTLVAGKVFETAYTAPSVKKHCDCVTMDS